MTPIRTRTRTRRRDTAAPGPAAAPTSPPEPERAPGPAAQQDGREALTLAEFTRDITRPHALGEPVPGKPPRFVLVQDAVAALSGLYACTAMQNPFLVGPYPPAADGAPERAEPPAEDDAAEVSDPDAYPAEVVIAAHRHWGYMLLGVLNARGQVERVQITTPGQLADAAREATYAEFIEERACLHAGSGGRHWVAYYFEERTGRVSYQDYGKVRRYTVRFPRHITVIVREGRQKSVYMWAVGRRPSARHLDDPLYVMPIGNVYDRGWVCLGSIQQSDLAHRSPEAIDRLILEESHYTAAAMSGCSRSHPDTVLALWQEMHTALTGPAAERYRYPMDDLVPVRVMGDAGPLTVRHLYAGAYPFTRLG